MKLYTNISNIELLKLMEDDEAFVIYKTSNEECHGSRMSNVYICKNKVYADGCIVYAMFIITKEEDKDAFDIFDELQTLDKCAAKYFAKYGRIGCVEAFETVCSERAANKYHLSSLERKVKILEKEIEDKTTVIRNLITENNKLKNEVIQEKSDPEYREWCENVALSYNAFVF